MKCVSCGYEKNHMYTCSTCSGLVCHQCMEAGECKDCAAKNCEDYDEDYVYA